MATEKQLITPGENADTKKKAFKEGNMDNTVKLDATKVKKSTRKPEPTFISQDKIPSK